MANILPSPHLKHVKMMPGERELAARLMTKLEDDCTVWFDVPVGQKQLRPDFIILHPGRGILVLEVKDWNLNTIRKIDHKTVEILTERGVKHVPNPLEQARSYAIAIKEKLEHDNLLIEHDNSKYKGRLIFAWGYGVVLTNITRKQLEESHIDQVIASDKVICKDEMVRQIKSDVFQQRLWNMFPYDFGSALSKQCIDRVRWHLFPDIRIEQGNLFGELSSSDSSHSLANDVTDIVKVMDCEQEKFARNLGDGHRMIHGVAGSGKTLIIAQRASQLSSAGLPHPILVLCYNKTLAIRLNDLLATKGVGANVHVRHFHGWCKEMCSVHHLELVHTDRPIYERQVEAVIVGFENGRVPPAQYSAILIDEGHDFEADWFKLIVHMVDPATDSILLVYDDVQSIYKRKKPKSWVSVGFNVPGKRTKIFDINYRNTVESIDLAYGFVSDYLDVGAASETIPLVHPEKSLRHGSFPLIKAFPLFGEEMRFLSHYFAELHEQGIPLSSMAVLCRFTNQIDAVCKEFARYGVKAETMMNGNAPKNAVRVLTMHSSKGLEFYVVGIPDLGCMPCVKAEEADEARLLYVAMTRAIEKLVLTYHSKSRFTNLLSARQGY